MRVLLVFAWLLVACAHPAFGAGEEFEGRPVFRVEFFPSTQPIPLPELYNMLSVRPGRPFRIADVRRTIKRLYATGRYSDVRVDAEEVDGDLVVTISTEGQWFIGGVRVDGVSAPPSEAQLENTTKLELGTLFHEGRLAQAIGNMQADLERNGLVDSRIETSVTRDPGTQQVFVNFQVHPPERARYARPVITGDPVLDSEKILSTTGWRRWLLGTWRKVTDRRTQEGLERLRRAYVKRDRLLAEIRLVDMRFEIDTRSVTPELNIQAGPRVRLELTGARLSTGRLRQLVPIYEERSVDRDLLMEGARNITEDLQSRGFFDTEADFRFEPPINGEQVIHYLVDTGPRGKLVEIDVKGNRYFTQEEIRERLATNTTSFQFRRGRFSQNLLDRDLDTIRELYRANGFRDVEVEAQVTRDLDGRAGQYGVEITIQEGPQIRIEEFVLTGVRPAFREQLEGLISSTRGQAFSPLNISIDRDTILAFYYERGFSTAAFEWAYKPGTSPERVKLEYILLENEQHYLRGVLVNGLQITDPGIVWRRIRMTPGDPLSFSQMIETQRQLYATGVFSKVDAAIQNPEGQEDYKQVVFDFEEARRYSATGGLGLEFGRIGGSDIGLTQPGGGATFAPRVSFDFTRLNFLGKAHTASFKSRFSTLQKRTLLSYLAPRTRGWEKLDLSFTALFDDSRNIRTFSARRLEGSVQGIHSISRVYTAFYRYTYRRVKLDQATLKITPEFVPLVSQPIRIGIASGSLVQDRRDNPVNSTRGIYNTVDFGVATGQLGSETDFLRLVTRNSTYHRLGGNVVLARTVNLGFLHRLGAAAVDGSEFDIPLAERFFAGGASSHRGFPENQAGPRDLQTGFPLGGKALLTNSVELRFPLLGTNIGGVLFHDAGNVYSSLGDVSFRIRQRNLQDFNYMVQAAGFGIRYNTPIGPVRLDLAYSLNSPRFNGYAGTREELALGLGRPELQRINRFQFHFSLGQTF